MRVSFNMAERLFNIFMFFKKGNFTVTRVFNIDDIEIKEYTYNLSRYLTDVWPPDTSTVGFPIRSVIREDDGTDVTASVLKFSGPRKNHVNPVSLFKSSKKIRVRFVNFGIRVSVEDVWRPYVGDVTVTDILGFKKVVTIDYKKKDGAHIPT